MTVIELAKLLATHIGQGRGKYCISIFQWGHGSEPVLDLIPREACEILELYSGTVPAPEPTDDTSDLV